MAGRDGLITGELEEVELIDGERLGVALREIEGVEDGETVEELERETLSDGERDVEVGRTE